MNSRRCVHNPMRAPGRPRSHHPTDALTWCVGALCGRYSRAISSINDLLTEWDSMSYVQKASPIEYSRLILDGEAIINDERLAWQKTGIRKDNGTEGKGEETLQNESDKAKAKAKDTETSLVTAVV